VICRNLRWKGFYSRDWTTEEELRAELARNECQFSCLQTCQPWGPDDSPFAPDRCTADRPCFTASRAITLYTQVPTGRAASENVVPDATVPIFVVASAVNPAVADRYTSYPATPTASVDAVHVNATVVPDTFACNAVGTVGAVVSAGAATTADA